MTNKFDLSIIIPAYSEAKRIGTTLDKLADFIKNDKVIKNLKIEVLVVSADSKDNTHDIISTHAKDFTNFTLIKPGPRVGKGRDVRVGMLKARGDAVVFMDADLATPLKYLPIFYRRFRDGADVIVATRNLKKHHPEFLRRSLSIFGNVLFRAMGGVWIEDSQCGFKMFSRAANKVCFTRLKTLGWGFDMEILTIAKSNHYKIVSVRVDDWKSVPGGSFVSGALKSSIESLVDLTIIMFRRLTGRYR